MLKSIISEGKTTNEAIENGLKQLNVSKNDVDIKIIENSEKRSFFSILSPRIVKVELIIKEKKENIINNDNNIIKNDNDQVENIYERKEILEKFLEIFKNKINNKDFFYNVEINNNKIYVEFSGEASNKLIGYRGETLNSFQNILSGIINKNFDKKVKLFLDISGYRNKREKALEELAVKISKTVQKTGKSITLEPMSAYERKIIHSKLQDNNKIKTYSIGEEPNRRITISKNN